jgi:YidC/Oxa1 family membrane protein insertase
VQLVRETPSGLTLTRTITLKESYSLEVTDEFVNTGRAVAVLPAHTVRTGPMDISDEKTRARDSAYLGLDSLAVHGGEGVQYWMQSRFMHKSPVLALLSQKDAATGELPLKVKYPVDSPVAWLAVKNKFFAQILTPPEENAGFEVLAARAGGDGRGFVLESVASAVAFPDRMIEPGARWSRTMGYYVGPKDYALLKKLGTHQVEIMEFGRWFGWICKILLPTLNGLYAVIPNYGVAIILLTLIVRVIFWPVTHKSTESMKKMQAIQPLVTKIREKYKDKPQKMNQEIMALYKEHKVNPVSGCLPMLVQIPVFIALFTVLRSAIELRFSTFLWIRDLSEPEGLFAATPLFQMLPFVHSLNILPLLMTATTIWQQKLTPTTGDPQQQKMMMFMPVFMLFLFYSMASALVLYWTVSQVLSIVQLLWQQRQGRAAEAAAA